MKVVIIGGGAGGLSCAARLRRLDDKAEITVLEQTNEVSIANCGLPYYIGGVIALRNKMQVAETSVLTEVFRINLRLNCRVTAIEPATKKVTTADGSEYAYDKLVLATGAAPIVPPLEGLDRLPWFTLKHLADADKIKNLIKDKNIQTAAVIGGGFIGVETAENLNHLGIKVSLIEMAPQILPPLDEDMVRPLQHELGNNGIMLYLGNGLKGFEHNGVILNSGQRVPADMAVLAIGIRPETALAQAAGIATNVRGAILTDDYMRTNLPDIYACGDNVAVKDFVSGQRQTIALAGPANRQGRLIADHIAGQAYPYTATQGTGVVKVCGLTAAFTGNNEKQLQRAQIPYHKMLINGTGHAGYYPDAKDLTLKVLYDDEGKILGAQAVGAEGADKRIDVIATVMRLNGTTKDLRDAELCYAPPYSSAKDPVNIIGMAIENLRAGLYRPYFGTDFGDMLVLDVRPAEMYHAEHIDGAINIPAAQLRDRLHELPKDKTIMVHCVKGYTSYVAARILLQNGFDNVLSYAGGWKQYKALKNLDSETGGVS